jgi:hypothetical protein
MLRLIIGVGIVCVSFFVSLLVSLEHDCNFLSNSLVSLLLIARLFLSVNRPHLDGAIRHTEVDCNGLLSTANGFGGLVLVA